jgi:hypothetical protein
MILDLVQRDSAENNPNHRNFHSLRQLIERSHERPAGKAEALSRSAQLVRSLGRTGILRLEKDTRTDYRWIVVDQDLQLEFSLHQALSPWLVEGLEGVSIEDPDYALDLLSYVEAILEDPRVVLMHQADRLKTELMAQMKADGVPYDERIARLEEVSHPQPCADQIYASFDDFRGRHDWVRGENPRPKSIGRELFEGYLSFADFVRRYGLQRSEGVLLRYLSQLYKTLGQNVPERFKTDAVHDIIGFLRAMLESTDTSLLEEWESLLHPELRLEHEGERQRAHDSLRAYELFHDPRAFASRVRAELYQLLRALSRSDWEEAAGLLRPGDREWDAQRLEEAFMPLIAEQGPVQFDHAARQAHNTAIESLRPRVWRVCQTLNGRDGEEGDGWVLEGLVDLSEGQPLDGPLFDLVQISFDSV